LAVDLDALGVCQVGWGEGVVFGGVAFREAVTGWRGCRSGGEIGLANLAEVEEEGVDVRVL
jgi:hypothetical protein